MPDDAPPPEPPAAPPQLSAPSGPAKVATKADRIDSTREMLGRGYSPEQVIRWLESDTVDKDWKVGRSTARGYVDLAMESLEGEIAAPKSRKQARTRAMLTMVFQRAMTLASDNKNVAKAAGLLTAAIQAADKIARIDGSYAFDGSSLLPPAINPATPEEAVKIVAHAQATIDLALRRGALVAKNANPPPVIDASSSEVEEEDDGDPEDEHAN